jgi:hypothetical protein
MPDKEVQIDFNAPQPSESGHRSRMNASVPPSALVLTSSWMALSTSAFAGLCLNPNLNTISMKSTLLRSQTWRARFCRRNISSNWHA